MSVTPLPPPADKSPRGAGQGAGDLGAFTTFMQLERRARQSETLDSLKFLMVNETRRLVEYRQAVLVLGEGGGARVAAVSSVAEVDRNAPFVRWMLAFYREAVRRDGAAQTHPLDKGALSDRVAGEWQEWSAAHALWVPLVDRDGHPIGALILFRDARWSEAETVMVDRIAECFAHAWDARARGGIAVRRHGWRRRLVRLLVLAILLAAVALMFLPVPQTALAPAEIVPRDPIVMAAPMDGVIAEFAVDPNQSVEAGAPLFRLEDTDLRAEQAVAARTLDVARAELRRATQQAFGDPESSAEVAVLKARVAVRAAELAHAEERLERIVVRADSAGLAVFTDPNDWIGRPVRTGERVLVIADPARAEIRIDLPVADAIALDPGAAVELYLDVDPLEPLTAAVDHASYEAAPTPAGVLAYRVIATLATDGTPPRIGLHGTAKIEGRPVPLAFYLLRRPIAAARQFLGL